MPAPPLSPEPAPSVAQTVFLGVFALVVGFVAYQVSSGIGLVVLLLAQGNSLQDVLGILQSGLGEHAYEALIANAVGQAVGLALLALLATRLTTPRVGAFLRLRRPEVLPLLAAVAGAICLVPVVQLLSDVNRLLPMPSWLVELERSQLVLLEAVLGSADAWLLNLLLLAVTPAICEELLFRGYFQRQVGRVVSVRTAILLSGILFGLYHLRLTQALPLSVLGIYLAYVVWRTDSLVTGIVVHFVYNGLLVLSAPYLEGATDPDAGALFPPYVALLGLALFGALMFWLHPRAARAGRPGSEPEAAYSAGSTLEPPTHER